MSRFLLVFGFVLALLTAGSTARAETLDEPTSPPTVAPSRHHIEAVSGLATTVSTVGSDGHLDDSGAGIGLRSAYAFQLVRGFEIGAGGAYWRRDGVSARTAYQMFGQLRAYVPIGSHDQVELGARFAYGYGILIFPNAHERGGAIADHAWTGSGMDLGVDLRTWINPRLALVFGPELTVIRGTDPDAAKVEYLNTSGGLIAVALRGGLVVGL
jgi:hypothetical protein